MLNRVFSLVGLFVLVMCLQQPLRAEAATGESPHVLIERTASELQQRLDGRQAYFEKNPAELYTLINEVLLPGFDVAHAGKLVLGRRHWTAATAEQRERFISVFYGFLVKTYATAVLNFDQRNLVVQPQANFSEDGNRAMVRTSVRTDAGDVVQVNYTLHRVNGEWKIYDVRVDGVSYVQNYRSQFDAEISANGIDAVIKRLEAETVQFDVNPVADEGNIGAA